MFRYSRPTLLNRVAAKSPIGLFTPGLTIAQHNDDMQRLREKVTACVYTWGSLASGLGIRHATMPTISEQAQRACMATHTIHLQNHSLSIVPPSLAALARFCIAIATEAVTFVVSAAGVRHPVLEGSL
jgi:hypothetical protein